MTNPNDNNAKLEALLRRTQAAQDSAQRTVLPPSKPGLFSKGGKPANESVGEGIVDEIRETAGDVREGMKIVRDVKSAFGVVKDKVFDPIWSVISPPFKLAWKGYSYLWGNYAYSKDKETGEKTFNKTKAAILLKATFAAAVAATPTLPGEMVRYATWEPAVDTVLMMSSMKHGETLYNVKSHNIGNDTYDIQGCRQPTNCNADMTKTFRLEERLSHTVWNTAANGHPFFMTDRIAAAIPQGNNKCEIQSYSGRISVLKYFHIFPKALDVKCTPMAGGEVIPTHAPAPALGG
jgi:hypothetical protein